MAVLGILEMLKVRTKAQPMNLQMHGSDEEAENCLGQRQVETPIENYILPENKCLLVKIQQLIT